MDEELRKISTYPANSQGGLVNAPNIRCVGPKNNPPDNNTRLDTLIKALLRVIKAFLVSIGKCKIIQ